MKKEIIKSGILSAFLFFCMTDVSVGNITPPLKISYTKNDILIKLPLLFSDYDKLLGDHSDYIYPGSFDIDNAKNIYIQYVYQPKNDKNIVVKYDKQGNYVGFFLIQNGGKGIAGEGIHVTSNNGKEVALVSAPNGELQYYDISNKYLDNTSPLLKSEKKDIYNQFSLSKSGLLVEKSDAKHSLSNPRNTLIFYPSKNNDRIEITQNIEFSGYITANAEANAENFNKRQGLALGDGFFVASYGAFYFNKIPQTQNTYQGIRIFSMHGDLINEKIFPPRVIMAFLHNNRMGVSRIENEGVSLSRDGKIIYSMYIYSDRKHPEVAKKEGIVILQDYVNKLIKTP